MEQTQKLKQAVKDYREGKTEAFTSLYEESSKYIYTCIYKVMAGTDNANDVIADIMQDTYVEISKNIGQLESDDKFLYWASRTANRKCYAYLKKNKKYVLLNEEDNTFDNLSDNDSIIPEEVMQDKEKQRLVREIIDTQLTEMQKLCIVAYYYNEQKQSEIAQELGIPENTVKTNLSRAKAKIKEGVLDLEKKEGTKLYSVAPFLLLLFKEDVQAAIIPEQLTKSVMSAVSASTVSASTGIAAKGVVGKIASASLKAKIVAAIVTVGVVGGVSGTVYMASQNREQEAVSQAAEIEADNDTDFIEVEETTEVAEENNITIVDDVEIDTSTPSKEFGNYIIFDEKKITDYEVNLEVFTSALEGDYTIKKTIPVYYTTGNQAGYLKSGTTIHVENGTEEWLRFNPKTDGITVPFFLVRVEDVLSATTDNVNTVDNVESVTADEVKNMIIEDLSIRDYVTPKFMDEATSDMENIKFYIDKYSPYVDSEVFNYLESDTVNMLDYTTYYVECVDKENKIECTVYYKDLYVAE